MKKERTRKNLAERLLLKTADLLFSIVTLEGKNGFPLTTKEREEAVERQSANEPALEYQPDFPYQLADPRILFLKKFLELTMSQLDSVEPASFRLKKLADWRMRMTTSFFLSQMAWACRTNCVFCFQKGNHPCMRIKKRMTREEMDTRLKYYHHGSGLIGGMYYEADEVLNNPHIRRILTEVRRRTRELIYFTTNGSSLTPSMIAFLSSVKPVFLHLSLNSSDSILRGKLMNDPHPRVAIQSLHLLRRRGIPYRVNIVAWKGLPFDDIEKSIAYAQKYDACEFRISLPALSRYFPGDKDFDAKKMWYDVVKYVDSIKKKYDIPIVIIPNEFVRNVVEKRMDKPFVIGAVRNSPAYKAGMKCGDVIEKVCGKKVELIEDAMDLLSRNRGNDIEVVLDRNGRELSMTLKCAEREHYPYVAEMVEYEAPHGILLRREDLYLSRRDVKDIRDYILVNKARSVLVVTSALAKPYLKHLMKMYGLFDNKHFKVHVLVVKNAFFGGSIAAADLLVVDDMVRSVKGYAKQRDVDLVIIPASPFNAWGRDLIGTVNLQIERAISIPVEFVYNQSFLPY